MCSLCNATFERCAVCDAEACTACVADHVLKDSDCTHFTSVAHCTGAEDSKCMVCSFWHAPTPDVDGCDPHAVWWVTMLAVLRALLVFAIVATLVVTVVVVVVNAVTRYVREKKQLAKADVF